MGDQAPVAARVAPPRRRCAAVALCALLSGPVAHAQSPAVLADARAALKAGRADRALAPVSYTHLTLPTNREV